MNDDLTFCAVGDIGPIRSEPGSIFRHVADTLAEADILFGNLEIPLSERGTPPPQTSRPLKSSPKVAAALREHGFDVVSFANNHCMDWGVEGFLDTIEHVKGQGINLTGAGKNIAEARVPAVVSSGNTTIGFLAYNSILREGYRADHASPGCAPMRAWTFYEQIETHQPGTAGRVQSFPHREDLKNLLQDITNAKKKADLVVVSFHWGIHFVPEEIADYQFDVAHAAIDAGADLIIGHHPHILKGVETYKGKAIFYSLGNFAFDWSTMAPRDPNVLLSSHLLNLQSLNSGLFVNPNDALPLEMRMTGVVKCRIQNKRIENVWFKPAWIEPTWEPRMLAAEDQRYSDVSQYIERITRGQKLQTGFEMTKQGISIVLA